jgi:hypothetical protein
MVRGLKSRLKMLSRVFVRNRFLVSMGLSIATGLVVRSVIQIPDGDPLLRYAAFERPACTRPSSSAMNCFCSRHLFHCFRCVSLSPTSIFMKSRSSRLLDLRRPIPIIDTVVSKYCNHAPLYRQSVILERDIGLEISRATLDGWFLKVGELMIPLVAAMRRELVSGTYIQHSSG